MAWSYLRVNESFLWAIRTHIRACARAHTHTHFDTCQKTRWAYLPSSQADGPVAKS